MWFVPGISTVPPELLNEVWLCAHLMVLHRRRDAAVRLDEAEIRRETCTRARCGLGDLVGNEWGRETMIACYQRATDEALALDVASLQRACGVGDAFRA